MCACAGQAGRGAGSSIAQLSPKAVGRIPAHSHIARPVPRGGWGEGWAGGRCLLFIMLNFCKINCICKSNTELLDYANPTAEASVERVGHLQLKRPGEYSLCPLSQLTCLTFLCRTYTVLAGESFFKAIDRLFLVLSCNNIPGLIPQELCFCLSPVYWPHVYLPALVTPAPQSFGVCDTDLKRMCSLASR